jgi:tetratricopeptide (TPR) repeat protein
METLCFVTSEARLVLQGTLLVMMSNPWLDYQRGMLMRRDPMSWFLAVGVLVDIFEHLNSDVGDPTSLVEGAEALRRGLARCAREDSTHRCLLGLAEFQLDNFRQAAVEWESLLQQKCLVSVAKEVLQSSSQDPADWMLAHDWRGTLERPISLAWEQAGEMARAIEWQTAAIRLKAKPGDHRRLARLHVKNDANYMEAYKALCKELENEPPETHNPDVDILRAVAEGAGLPAIDDYFRHINRQEPARMAQGLIEKTLRMVWPEFSHLSKNSAEWFVEALYSSEVLEGLGENMRFEWAIMRYVGSAESELHATVFQPFKRQLTKEDLIAARKLRDDRWVPLREWILEDIPMSIHGALNTVQNEPSDLFTKKLRSFLDTNFPKSIRHAQYLEIASIRAIPAHPIDTDGNPKVVTRGDALRAMELCRSLLTELHSAPSGQTPMPSAPGRPISRTGR